MMKNRTAKYTTENKVGAPVLEASGIMGEYDSLAVDCPFVFYHNNKYYMMHVGYDGTGYQTALATSRDLIHWEREAVIFPRNESAGWDQVSVAGVWILKNDNMYEKPTLKKIDGKYWLLYHSYPSEGYEQGPAEIGLAYTEDETLHQWTRLDKPVLTWKNGNDWEKSGLYKGCMVERDGKYYMFYNAKDSEEWIWHEQIGMAVSDNMFDWRRVYNEPVIKNTEGGWDSKFCADPFVLWDGELWVMFYYGYDGEHAQEGIAFSKDLLHWEKYEEPILLNGKAGEIDSFHAHKPSIVYDNGTLYHFYCAVRESRISDKSSNQDPTKLEDDSKKEYRCITVAKSC